MLLAVDSSTQWIGMALYDGVKVISQMGWHSQNNHSVELSSAISSLLEKNNVPITELSVMAVALGPGSYTCLRVGLAVVKGISLGRKIPVIGVPTLDFLVYPIPADTRPLMALLVAGRGRFAYSFFRYDKDHWVCQNEPALATPAEVADLIQEETIVCGELDGDTRTYLKQNCPYAGVLSPARSSRNPAFLAEIAWQRFSKGEKDDIVTLAPIYSRVEKAIPA